MFVENKIVLKVMYIRINNFVGYKFLLEVIVFFFSIIFFVIYWIKKIKYVYIYIK